MAYDLRPHEPIPAEIQRVMREQLDRIDGHLRGRDVHETRKRIKEIRSLLRLIRKPLAATFRRENAWYRDVAHELSATRDAEATLEAIGRLKDATQDSAQHERLDAAQQRLEQRLGELAAAMNVEPLLARLEGARARIAEWPVLADDFQRTLVPGLRRTLRRGHDAHTRATATRAATDFHELRKRVKDHWYHTRLTTASKKRAELVEQLSDVLGEQHDLVITMAQIGDDTLLPLLTSERLRLEGEALHLAGELYAKSARKWTKRVRAHLA